MCMYVYKYIQILEKMELFIHRNVSLSFAKALSNKKLHKNQYINTKQLTTIKKVEIQTLTTKSYSTMRTKYHQ